MILGYKEIAKKISNKYFAHSCINANDIFRNIMASIKPVPKTIVEIGTYFGVSTIILASISNVYTFDVEHYPEIEYVWNKFKTLIDRKVLYYIVENSDETKEILNGVPFDFAFVDSVHDYENAKIDFKIVERCGRVLFHDNNDSFPGVAKFCNEIRAKKIGDFGYWEAK